MSKREARKREVSKREVSKIEGGEEERSKEENDKKTVFSIILLRAGPASGTVESRETEKAVKAAFYVRACNACVYSVTLQQLSVRIRTVTVRVVRTFVRRSSTKWPMQRLQP